MITKSITSGERAATAVISEETRFLFSTEWNFFHVKNLGTDTVYISMTAGATAGADGVIAIPTGESACTAHGYTALSVYVTAAVATDKVQVIGSNIADSPFKLGKKGGGINTSDATATATDILVGKTAYIADGTKATGTAVQGIYPIGTNGRPKGAAVVPHGVVVLSSSIFRDNYAVTSVWLPDSCTSIEAYSFSAADGITDIHFGNAITALPNYLCAVCSQLKTLTIPASVTSVGTGCCIDCEELTTVTCNAAAVNFGASAFDTCVALTIFNTVANFNPSGLNLSSSPVTHDSLVALGNNLVTLSTAKALVLGTTNLAKLSASEKAVFTNKLWTLS